MEDSLSDDQQKEIAVALSRQVAKVDPKEFIEWLRRELANYRNIVEITSGLTSVKQDEAAAKSLGATISTLIHDLQEMSPDLANRLDAELMRQGHAERDVASQRLIRDLIGGLTQLEFALTSVGLSLAHEPGPGKGRRRNYARDSFLDLVKERLVIAGVPKIDVPATAAEILLVCAIDAPQDGRTRPEKRGGKN